MKYIEFPELTRLAQALTHEGPECSVHTRIEAYSCKNIKRDKKLFKSLEHAYNDELSHSPPLPSWLDREPEETPFGPMDKHASRKTLYLLIATLNIAFPDHEFSDVRPAHFNKEKSGASVLNSLSTTLLSPHPGRGGARVPRTYSAYPPTSPTFFPSSVPTSSSSLPLMRTLSSPYAPPQIQSGTHPTLYRILDEVIGLNDCQVFSYSPDIDSDPHANDYSDDEDDVASVGDEYSSDDIDDEATFEFDEYDVDKSSSPRHPPSFRSVDADDRRPRIIFRKHSGSSNDDSPLRSDFPHVRLKRRDGALLWSSHWFFSNPKLKRILFITVWARTRRAIGAWDDEDDLPGFENDVGDSAASERFLGWEGGVGAGARALGLSASA